jgi:hypothetical protein
MASSITSPLPTITFCTLSVIRLAVSTIIFFLLCADAERVGTRTLVRVGRVLVPKRRVRAHPYGSLAQRAFLSR